MTDVDPVYESKDWKAWENHQPPGPATLHVFGTVSTRATNYSVTLERMVPQGFNPRILLLRLIVTQLGAVGGDAITPHEVTYEETVHDGFEPGDYDSIAIVRPEGAGGAQIDDIEIVE